MKKASRTEPSAASLREMPEVRFERYRVRRSPYASRIAREGSQLVHDQPSSESLAEIPEADFTTARVRKNPYVVKAGGKLRAAEPQIQYGRGRPRAGEESGPTPPRSLRLPQAMWHALDAAARERHTSTHALLREVIAAFVETLPNTIKSRM
jgi:hypothetical protein